MKTRKPHWKMTVAELRAATKEFDAPLAFEKGKPLTAADQARFAKARAHARRAKPGRPRVGKGAARITTTVERSLLGRADRYAKANGLSRAQVIARGIEALIGGLRPTG